MKHQNEDQPKAPKTDQWADWPTETLSTYDLVRKYGYDQEAISVAQTEQMAILLNYWS